MPTHLHRTVKELLRAYCNTGTRLPHVYHSAKKRTAACQALRQFSVAPRLALRQCAAASRGSVPTSCDLQSLHSSIPLLLEVGNPFLVVEQALPHRLLPLSRSTCQRAWKEAVACLPSHGQGAAARLLQCWDKASSCMP
ncbi:hypothetical protein HAX54_013735 [Datura stramonium]|uniref:Uncharacterized protein n=1 Tax=Datura stramonium TaxID=4076 RepID=A0ABS8TNL8_DATST|nr:hypothetical protein [Datura stramonium]